MRTAKKVIATLIASALVFACVFTCAMTFGIAALPALGPVDLVWMAITMALPIAAVVGHVMNAKR